MLDQILFWNVNDLENKLEAFQHYYNVARSHSSLDKITPEKKAHELATNVISIDHYRWKPLVRNLFQLPAAA